jgi:hypothetical protein
METNANQRNKGMNITARVTDACGHTGLYLKTAIFARSNPGSNGNH